MSTTHTTFRVSWNPFDSDEVVGKTVTVAHSDRETLAAVEDTAIEMATIGVDDFENAEAEIVSGYFA